ncbi:endospore germination permease [Cohnella ginsengisoli]|uniref:Endospore germination permease n=1 Tax=Cohnella ginsengisoli TaxID=425004 RepID=A0A9X4QPV8_9BACL|nr:endospore germination permease [Cohnella ginsengisoli]MDG0793926.1 endospore germination permease [Cohnella ginsengisoli]
MQVTEKISRTQLGYLIFTFIISTNLLTVPSFTVMFAMQDAWISELIASATGFVSIWVMCELSRRYPGLTIEQYSARILGKWLGKLAAASYAYYWFISISTLTTQHTGFVSTLLLPESPFLVISLTLLALSGIAAFLGIEVIARSNEFLTLLLLVLFIPLLVLTIKDADVHQLKPIVENGFGPVLQGAFNPAGGFMNQVFILGWLLSYYESSSKARKVSLIALTCVTLMSVSLIMLTVMILGPLTDKLTYSFLSVVQYIGIEGSFERLEAIAVSTWVIGCFVKISVSLFIFCVCISRIFGISDYRDLVFPLSLLSLIGSVWIFPNAAALLNYLVFTFPLLAFLNQSLIPLLLLIVDAAKRKAAPSML